MREPPAAIALHHAVTNNAMPQKARKVAWLSSIAEEFPHEDVVQGESFILSGRGSDNVACHVTSAVEEVRRIQHPLRESFSTDHPAGNGVILNEVFSNGFFYRLGIS